MGKIDAGITRAAAAALTVLFLAASLAGIGASAAQTGDGEATWTPAEFSAGFEPIASGFDRPVFLADPNDGSGRLFIVEQQGTIRILLNGEALPDPYLDLSGDIDAGGPEQGLLSMAFDPDYAANGRFYVGYTGLGSTNVVSRFEVDPGDANRANPDSERVLISVADPYPNHNGGLVMFGPDGYLYAGMGDGGSGGDPEGNGQDLGALLGKILRIDVRGAAGDAEPFYRVPDDNPFVTENGAAPEVWAYGLRNPWRFSFDRATGDLYIADVGQRSFEEVSFQSAGSSGGENYGWNVLEGASCYPVDAECDSAETVLPVATYGRDAGVSVTGGYVYRGASEPDLAGVYVFADFGSGNLWGLARDSTGDWTMSEPIESGLSISSFSEDAAGELYATAFDGTIYRIVGARS